MQTLDHSVSQLRQHDVPLFQILLRDVLQRVLLVESPLSPLFARPFRDIVGLLTVKGQWKVGLLKLRYCESLVGEFSLHGLTLFFQFHLSAFLLAVNARVPLNLSIISPRSLAKGVLLRSIPAFLAYAKTFFLHSRYVPSIQSSTPAENFKTDAITRPMSRNSESALSFPDRSMSSRAVSRARPIRSHVSLTRKPSSAPSQPSSNAPTASE